MDYDKLQEIEAKAMQEVKEDFNNIPERTIEVLFEHVFYSTEEEIGEYLQEGVAAHFADTSLATLINDYSILAHLEDMELQEQIDTVKRAYGTYGSSQFYLTEEQAYLLVD